MFGFGNKKREREAEEAQRANDSLVKKISDESFETGLHGTMGAFGLAWRETTYSVARQKLREGAIQAFVEEGRADNLQFMLSNRTELNIKAYNILLQLIKDKNSDQALNLINRALEKLPELDKQAILDDALLGIIETTSSNDHWNHLPFTPKEEVFMNVLLQAGANANMDAGRAFALAIESHTPAVVKLLRAHGAEYKDAALIMQVEGWRDNYSRKSCIEKLRAYQEHDDVDTMGQLLQNIRDLTERLDIAEARLDKLQPDWKIRPATPSTTQQKVLRRDI